MRLVHLGAARAKHVVIMGISSSTLPRRAVSFSDGPHTWLALLASTMAKVSRGCTRENLQSALYYLQTLQDVRPIGKTCNQLYVRVWFPRRAMHASCQSPCQTSAKHHFLGACLPLMTPFRGMLFTLRGGSESLATRAHQVPVYLRAKSPFSFAAFTAHHVKPPSVRPSTTTRIRNVV